MKGEMGREMGNILEMKRKEWKDRTWATSEGAHSHLEMGQRHVFLFVRFFLIAKNKRMSKGWERDQGGGKEIC